jgi:hypothetical protein
MHTRITVALIALLLAACSSEQIYATGRNAQRAECVKQADGVSRDRCLKDADMSRDTYKKEADAARK